MSRIAGNAGIYLARMATNSTLLCIHRDPAQLSLLQENGYELVTATNGSDGLRLLKSQPVDAIVLEYHLGLLDGAVVAAEIRKAKPQLPIVMLADHLDLPEGALKSVDALVTKADGAHFLWQTVNFVLNVKPTRQIEEKLRPEVPANLRRPGQSRYVPDSRPVGAPNHTTKDRAAPFSPKLWKSIRDGSVAF